MLDQEVAALGVKILPTPVRAPKANSRCERVVGSIRRECLDWLISLGERHLRRILNSWVTHYNHGRVHMSLGPGIPMAFKPRPPENAERHRIPDGHRIRRRAVLGGLHREILARKRRPRDNCTKFSRTTGVRAGSKPCTSCVRVMVFRVQFGVLDH